MSIRFTCTACRSVMKIDGMIHEEKKVRCTGCRIVIVLTPDPSQPNGIALSFPKKSDKPKGMSDGIKRILLLSALAILAVVVGVGLWYNLSGPQERGPIEGEVDIDGLPLEKGRIDFVTEGAPKVITASAPIVRGRYSLRASQGPGLGKNKVSIFGDDGATVAPRFNKDSKLELDIGLTGNTKKFEVSSK